MSRFAQATESGFGEILRCRVCGTEEMELRGERLVCEDGHIQPNLLLSDSTLELGIVRDSVLVDRPLPGEAEHG